MSGYRWESDCRSGGCKFDLGLVPYFHGDWSWWNIFYGHSPPFSWIIQEGLLSVSNKSMCTKYLLTTCSSTELHRAVGNVSSYRCLSDCRSRGHKFDPDPVPYFSGDWSWNSFYGHSPPFRGIIQEGLLSVTKESTCLKHFSSKKYVEGTQKNRLNETVLLSNQNIC